MQSNHSAHLFGELPSPFVGEAVHSVRFEKGGEFWKLFSFESTRIA